MSTFSCLMFFFTVHRKTNFLENIYPDNKRFWFWFSDARVHADQCYSESAVSQCFCCQWQRPLDEHQAHFFSLSTRGVVSAGPPFPCQQRQTFTALTYKNYDQRTAESRLAVIWFCRETILVSLMVYMVMNYSRHYWDREKMGNVERESVWLL